MESHRTGGRDLVKQVLKPLNDVLYIDESGIQSIIPDHLNIEIIGRKAYGLACLPAQWTLPFMVVSDALLLKYRSLNNEFERKNLVEEWLRVISEAAVTLGLQEYDDVIVRSSGCSEGLSERGQLYSVAGKLDEVTVSLNECLAQLSMDKRLCDQKIPLIIQKMVNPVSSKGHLSNERRCYEEIRDWLGEYEDKKTVSLMGQNFQINLRNWREKIDWEDYSKSPLLCNVLLHVRNVLKTPAAWSCALKARVHFEWVWDGYQLFLVQADEEVEETGIDPTQIYHRQQRIESGFSPQCLQVITQDHSLKYNKIRNVFIYFKLGLPITKLYVLDDQIIIKKLASGEVPKELQSDIKALVKESLIIRIDVATDDKQKRQLLPRIEVRNYATAIEWLIEHSSKMINSGVKEEIVFIFHNFVPAVSAAFAYSAPGERKVQIESLWGLPEGLYYNSHDKYVVDTQNSKVDMLNKEKFVINLKPRFKRFFISPDENGHWTPQIAKPPFDWKVSIQKEDWIREIALQSRRIAEEVEKPLSIMWFVDVPNEICPSKVFPWYHEYFDPSVTSRALNNRTKTMFDKSLVIQTKADIELLQKETQSMRNNIRRVRIQPSDNDLIRDKATLRTIGELTKKIDAVIILEGGVLSHAYYQLMETGAVVEVLHPFAELEDKREFNKLVRDKIPSNILESGEIVSETYLTGEFLLRALREKLVEEAFEVLDANDQESIVAELADLNEVIDGVLNHIGVSRKELHQKQAQKRAKAGGFETGVVLLETRNPLPTSKPEGEVLFKDADLSTQADLSAKDIMEIGNKVGRWTDRKEYPNETESIMRLIIPITNENWTAYNTERATSPDKSQYFRANLTGTRIGSKIQIELSLYSPSKVEQISLFENDAELNLGKETEGN